jgi:RIO kinase 1
MNEEVFKNVYIPRTLDEIETPLADIEKLRVGNDQDILYETVTGLKISNNVQDSSDDECSESEDANSGSGSEESESESEWTEKSSKLKKHEDKDSKKERKSQVKAEVF